MITKQQYVDCLNSTIVNYTENHLTERVDDVSRDVINSLPNWRRVLF